VKLDPFMSRENWILTRPPTGKSVSSASGALRITTGGGFSYDISSEIARFEVGLVAGGGVDVGRYGVIDARYFWGLTDVNRNATDGNRIGIAV
jgi:hypothetical protein